VKQDWQTRIRAQSLRRKFTDAERILWSRLKGKQLCGWQFRAQHPISPYIVDFAVVPLRLAVELDGGTHSTPDERRHDERRRQSIEGRGWTIVRFWNSDVYDNLDGVLRSIGERLPPKV
jgi:very-short-patch-repair endonuclease